MYAIISTGGKQYKVQQNQVVCVEKLNGDAGTKISFDKILFVGNSGEAKIGKPYLSGVSVEGEIVVQDRGAKILVMKKKRRKGYKKSRGHRQCFTGVKILKINA